MAKAVRKYVTKSTPEGYSDYTSVTKNTKRKSTIKTSEVHTSFDKILPKVEAYKTKIKYAKDGSVKRARTKKLGYWKGLTM